jgi:hypothetical protein
MAKKKTRADSFRERLDGLSNGIADDLRLASLEENGLEGEDFLTTVEVLANRSKRPTGSLLASNRS